MGSRDGLTTPFAATRAGRLCALLALAKVALLVPILERYGWDRDELYFLAAGRHLAFGYVDFPPLVAVAARAVDATVGPSLITLRLLSSLLANASSAVPAPASAMPRYWCGRSRSRRSTIPTTALSVENCPATTAATLTGPREAAYE